MTQFSSHSQEMQQDAVYGGAQHVSVSKNFASRVLAVVVNILVLAELCIAMYFGSQDMDNLTPIFFKVFFSLLIPTIIGTIFIRRLLAKRVTRTMES